MSNKQRSLVLSNKQSLFFLNQVKPFKVTWRVHVKCLHSWKINNNVDEHGEKLHVSAKRNQMYRLQRNFPIGEWRFIENYTVTSAGGKYRTTTSPYKMTRHW
ncbi:hypothetical protein YC2023_058876 [Brassica napus]